MTVTWLFLFSCLFAATALFPEPPSSLLPFPIKSFVLELRRFRPLLAGDACHHRVEVRLTYDCPRSHLVSLASFSRTVSEGYVAVGDCVPRCPFVTIRSTIAFNSQLRDPIRERLAQPRTGFTNFFNHTLFSGFLRFEDFENEVVRFRFESPETDLQSIDITPSLFVRNSSDSVELHDELFVNLRAVRRGKKAQSVSVRERPAALRAGTFWECVWRECHRFNQGKDQADYFTLCFVQSSKSVCGEGPAESRNFLGSVFRLQARQFLNWGKSAVSPKKGKPPGAKESAGRNAHGTVVSQVMVAENQIDAVLRNERTRSNRLIGDPRKEDRGGGGAVGEGPDRAAVSRSRASATEASRLPKRFNPNLERIQEETEEEREEL